jgi:hypothetical protein
MHIRQAIRDNLKTTLTGLNNTADRVYVNRLYPLTQSKHNAICIFTDGESVDYLTTGAARTQERIVSYKIEVYVRTKTDFDDKIDNILVEVESALHQDVTRGGNAVDTMIGNLQIEYNGDGEVPVGVGQLDVMVKYHNTEGSPTT